jgi:hypothetical protein
MASYLSTAGRTGLPIRLSISTSVSMVNFAVFLFITSETRGRDTIRILTLSFNDIGYTAASGFSELLCIIFSSAIFSQQRMIANIVHRVRPFSVAGQIKQQARSPGR